MSEQIVIEKKIDLLEDEDLMGFVSKIRNAVDSADLPDGVQSQNNGEPVRMYLRAVYRDYIIVKVWFTDQFFKTTFKRDKDGEIILGKWIEVVPTFIEKKIEKAEEEAPVEVETYEIVKSIWSNVLS